jgi:Zn-dependent metalloprotease
MMHHGIMPPKVLKHLAQHAKDLEHRLHALRTLLLTARLRGRRDIMSHIKALAPSLPHEFRLVYDCRGSEFLPGALLWTEGQSEAGLSAPAKRACDDADATWKLYQSFGRNSIDGHGLQLVSSIGYGDHYDNAFWDGQGMRYGAGDGILFNDFTVSLDIPGHEMTHGVTQYTAALEYHGQPGALNESVSDCFGSMVKQMAAGETVDKADWLIGQGLFTPAVHGRALRDMLNPGTAFDDPQIGKDEQPANMSGYVSTDEDDGGVHTNSGIPNRAFALTCLRLAGLVPGAEFSWQGGGLILYDVLTQRLTPTSDFPTVARAMVEAAGSRWGQGGPAQKAVESAYKDVGL